MRTDRPSAEAGAPGPGRRPIRWTHLALFLALSHGWTWAFWGLAAFLAPPGGSIWEPPGAWFFYLGGAGILLAGVVATGMAGGRAGVADLLRRSVDPRPIRLRWWAVLLLFYPILALATAAVAWLAGVPGGAFEPGRAASLLGDPAGLATLVVFTLVIGPLPEEIGWRGFLQDRLQGAPPGGGRGRALQAALLVAVAWWTWHLPLFVLPGYFEAFGREGPSPLDFLANIVPAAILYAWVFNHTDRSVLAVILFHFMENFTSEFLGLSEAVRPYRLGLAWGIAAGVVALWGPDTLARWRGWGRRGGGWMGLVLTGLVLGSGVGAAQTDSAGWTDDLEVRIPRWMEAAEVPGLNALVIQGGQVTWVGSFGVAGGGGEGPMTRDALFRVESISKPVTAWGVMRLVEAGRLRLDDPVQAHLAAWRPPPGTPPFTVEQLLSHTAGVGLGDFTDRHPAGGPVPDLREALAREFRMDALPGTRFAYSDTGFNLLELLVEEVTGEDFGDWMIREVLVPLGMADATHDWGPGLAGRMPSGHTLRGEPVAPYVYPGRGSGGLMATLDDVARFVQAGMAAPYRSGPPILSEASVARLHTAVARPGGLFGLVADGYGLGHFTETLSNGRTSVWHGGQGYGWMTHAQWVPETGDGIVLLANSQRAWPLFGHILGDWSRSLGVAPVGMSRVTLARPLALGMLALLLLAAAVQAGRLAAGVARRERGWTPLAALRRPRRLFQAGAGGLLLGSVAWASAQEYLFVFSILPGLTGWLGGALLAAGGVLVLSATLPITVDPEART